MKLSSVQLGHVSCWCEHGGGGESAVYVAMATGLPCLKEP